MAQPLTTTMTAIQLRLAAGGWVAVCRANAERLVLLPHVQVECMPFRTRKWEPMGAGYTYSVRMKFRARSKS